MNYCPNCGHSLQLNENGSDIDSRPTRSHGKIVDSSIYSQPGQQNEQGESQQEYFGITNKSQR